MLYASLRSSLLLSALAAALLVAPAHAQGDANSTTANGSQQDTIQTDRPGIADGSTVVGPGRFQIEAGVQREYRSGAHSDERTLYIPTLLRFGIDQRWEGRIETNSYSRDRFFAAGAGVTRSEGYSPISIGTKYHFQDAPEGSSKPSLGAIFRIYVPSGSSAFRSERVTGDLRLAADQQFTDKWALNWNAGIALYEDDAGKGFVTGLAAATATYQTSKRLTFFLDMGLQAPETHSGDVALLMDAGAMYLLDRNTQLDFGIGPGLTGKTTPDLFWTAGISRRF